MGDEKKHKCAVCGAESDEPEECCGQPMNEVTDDDEEDEKSVDEEE